jgi:hypothetical protein
VWLKLETLKAATEANIIEEIIATVEYLDGINYRFCTTQLRNSAEIIIKNGYKKS